MNVFILWLWRWKWFHPPCGVALVVVMVSSTPCGVAVVVIMVSSMVLVMLSSPIVVWLWLVSSMVLVKVVVMLSAPPVWQGGNGFRHPGGVAVVVVMVVVMVTRRQGHVKVLGARLTST